MDVKYLLFIVVTLFCLASFVSASPDDDKEPPRNYYRYSHMPRFQSSLGIGGIADSFGRGTAMVLQQLGDASAQILGNVFGISGANIPSDRFNYRHDDYNGRGTYRWQNYDDDRDRNKDIGDRASRRHDDDDKRKNDDDDKKIDDV